MSEPWFRPNGVLRYRPLTWQGRVLMAATWLPVIGFVVFAREESVAWIAGGIAFAIFFVGHAVVLWKMDWGYGRR
jgi:hypothetical protein